MNNKKLIIILACLVAVVAVSFAVIALVNRNATDATQKEFTVEFVHADSTVRTEAFVSNAAYLGDLLQKLGLIEGEESEYGLFITKADGEEAVYTRDNAYWALYINGEYAMTGIDTTPIEDGAVYALKYEKGN